MVDTETRNKKADPYRSAQKSPQHKAFMLGEPFCMSLKDRLKFKPKALISDDCSLGHRTTTVH